jgi:dipeptidyl aminopeptidase/acylaminoacyl peptidase
MKYIWIAVTVCVLAACRSGLNKQVHVEGSLATAAGNFSPNAELPPVEDFASLPEIEQLTLSPSGDYVAFLLNRDGDTALVTRSSDGGKDVHVVAKSNNEIFRIARYYWVGDDRLLISVRYPEKRQGVDTVEGRLIAVNRDGSELQQELFGRRLFGFDAVRNPNPQFQDAIVGMLPNDPRHVLIALKLTDPVQPDVYLLDVKTGERKLVQNHWAGITHWMADQEGRVRIGVAMLHSPPGVLVKTRQSDEWITPAALKDWHRQGKRVMPLGFDLDSDILYFSAEYKGKAAVFRLNIADSQANPELVFSDPDYDINGKLMYRSRPGRPIGAAYLADDLQSVYWDESGKALQQRVDAVLPGRTNYLASSSDDGSKHIVYSFGPQQPPEYYLLNERTNRIALYSETYPRLKPESLSPSRTVRIRARDGLELTGYLTIPKSGPEQNLPAVVLPHGGPWSRDINSFDYWTQFFASRGWAVLRVNFRGSAGFGQEFESAGFGRWGLEMQDDLTDSVNWLRDQNIARADRICIVGGSYGGYAAMMGLAKTPELYRCGVSFAGVADLLDFITHLNQYASIRDMIDQRLGGWWSDHARLKDTSPVNLATAIRSPLLIVHGEMDRRVPVDQSRDMASALKAAGADYQYLEMPLADHHLSRQEDRLLFFKTMDQFLQRYLSQP